MPPLHKHSRTQFLSSIPQTATPKFRILPLPTAHRTLILGGWERGKPSRLPACLLFIAIIVTEQLSTRHKKRKKKSIIVSVSSKISWLSIGITYCLHFKEGDKKNYEVPLALPLWSVYRFGYLLPHSLLVIAFFKRLTPLQQGISIATDNCRTHDEAVTIIKLCILRQTLSPCHHRLGSVRGC